MSDNLDEVLGLPPRIDIPRGVLVQNWWLVALRGVAGIVFGIFALTLPGAALLTLILAFCVYLCIDGVLSLTSAVRAARFGLNWGLLALEGAVDLIAAALAFAWPAATATLLVIIVAAWALVSGAVIAVGALAQQRSDSRWWRLAAGVVSLLLGILLLARPLESGLILTLLLGSYALAFGLILSFSALRLWRILRGNRRRQEEAGP